jgi:pilus assembly protein CpaE
MNDYGNSKDGGQDSRQAPDTPIKSVQSIALIGPHDGRRNALKAILSACDGIHVREFTSFPPDLEELPRTVGEEYDVVLLDVDSDPDFVFNLVERICTTTPACVMVYSAEADVKQAVRFMRAGAREYFTLPVAPSEVAGALHRAATQPALAPAPAPVHALNKTAGQVFVFLGSKGGCGVTSIAANFAVLVAQDSGQGALLIDFGLPLGDAGINLGMTSANYSTASALQDLSRLDARFLSSLVEKHSSGLAVLSAPGDFSAGPETSEGIDKLLEVARQNYSYIVVDVGSRVDLMESKLFEESSTVYLITQVGISELRNANRMITRFFALRLRSLQIVLNRYTPKALIFDDSQIAKALTRPANWKIPDDYSAARRTENSGTPIALDDSPISLVLRQMVRAACGLVDEKSKKKGFSLFKK